MFELEELLKMAKEIAVAEGGSKSRYAQADKAIAETIVNEVFKQQWNRYNKTTSAIIITEFIFLILISGCITNLVYRIVLAYLIDRYLLAEMGAEILAGSILLLIALMCYQIYKRADIKMKERMKKKKIEFRQFLKHTLR